MFRSDVVRVRTNPIAARHNTRCIEGQHIELSAEHEGQLGPGEMPVGPEIGIRLRDDEKTLHRSAGEVWMLWWARSRGLAPRLGGQLIEKLLGE